jgi:HEAT repeat protein
LSSQRGVEPLIEALRDKADNVRGSAATALGRLSSQRGVEPLIEALRDGAEYVRGSAATALGRLGSRSAVEPLIEALRDKDYDVRASAAAALGRLDSQKAVEPLIEALRDDDHINRASAAKALGKLGSHRAIAPLVEALRERDRNVRASVTGALMQITSQGSFTQIPQVLDAVLTHSPFKKRDLRGVLRELLSSAFSSGDIDLIRQSVNIVVSRIEGGPDILGPYLVALRHIDSGGHAAILERQYPEMREAAQLLIDLHLEKGNGNADAGHPEQAQHQENGQPNEDITLARPAR